MFGTKRRNKKDQSWASSTAEFVFLLMVVFMIRTFGFGLYQVPTGSMETTMLVGERFFADKLSYWFRDPRKGEVIAFNAPRFKYSSNPVKKLFEKYVWGPSNWTKRVIGVPGDHVRGVIENGKPVVYINDKKLDEGYLNKYPLILTYKQDPAVLHAEVNRELRSRGISTTQDNDIVALYREQRLHGQTEWRSYDPAVAYEDQPFYRLRSDWLIRDQDGNLQLRKPQEPNYMHSAGSMNIQGNRAWNGSDEFDIQLGPDEFWGMGDNRRGSLDCRAWGPIKREWIHGRILFRIWSIDSRESWWILDLIKHPIDFWHRTRWSRFFQLIP